MIHIAQTWQEILLDMAQHARTSADLHEFHGEHGEAARWRELADMWEARTR